MVICGKWLHEWELYNVNPRYQRCKRCGRIEPIACSHIWYNVKEEPVHSATTGAHVGFHIYMRCSNCGEYKDQLITGGSSDALVSQTLG